tara:strand:+ start:1879 stop:2175 length:297 start_codon:yes stop_codon:yes gene_type:complete
MESKYKYGPFVVLGIFIFSILVYVNGLGVDEEIGLSPSDEEGLLKGVVFIIGVLFLVFVVGFIVLFIKNRRESFSQEIDVVMVFERSSMPRFKKSLKY